MNERKSINKSDKIRIVFPSYMNLAKSEYNSKIYMRKPEEDFLVPMLGAEYRVENILKNQWNVPVCKLSYCGNLIEELVPLTVVKKSVMCEPCPYLVGDTLRFKLNVSADDFRYLESFFPSSFVLTGHDAVTLRVIINDLYLLVEYDRKLFEFPFLWTDFIKLDIV